MRSIRSRATLVQLVIGAAATAMYGLMHLELTALPVIQGNWWH